MTDENNIQVFVHVAAIDGVNKILSEIMDEIFDSGLHDVCEKIHFVLVGDTKFINFSIIDNSKHNILHYSNNINYCEFPTLHYMHLRASFSDGPFCYIHTKGITRKTEESDDWRKMMLYFNIRRWRDRISDLESFDTSGVNLLGDKDNYQKEIRLWALHPSTAPLHYSGNYWWATPEYLRSLPSPMGVYTPSEDWLAWRHMCEMWLCYNAEGRHACAHQSGVDHYYQRYPEDLYTQ